MINVTDILIENDTSGAGQMSTLIVVLNYATGVIALFIFIGDVFAIYIMKKCKRIPFQIKYLSISYILSDATGALVFVINQVVILMFMMSTDLTHNIRIVSVGIMLSVSWFSVAALSMDRAVGLKVNLRYATMVRRKTINITISIIWMFHIITMPFVMIYGFKTACNLIMDEHCNPWAATKLVRFYIMVLLLIVGFLVVGSNAYVHRIARRHERQIADIKKSAFTGRCINPDSPISERQLSATKAILSIIVSFVLFHAPIIIHLLVLESNIHARHELPRRLFHVFSFACIQINSFVNLFLYFGKFKEFKFQLYLVLGGIFKSFSEVAERQRVDVYNIVVSNDSTVKRYQAETEEGNN